MKTGGQTVHQNNMQSVVLVGQNVLNMGGSGYQNSAQNGNGASSFFMGGDVSSKNYHQISPRNPNVKLDNGGYMGITSSAMNDNLLQGGNLGNTGQYSFKGKRSGIYHQSSNLQTTNNYGATNSFTLMGANPLFTVTQTQNQAPAAAAIVSNDKLNSVLTPFPNSLGVNSSTSVKQQKHLLNKQYKKQLVYSEFLRQSSPANMQGKNQQNTYANSISKKVQNQQMLHVASLQQSQQQKFQQADQRQITHSPSLQGITQANQSQAGQPQQNLQSPNNQLNSGSLTPMAQRLQGQNTIVIIQQQSHQHSQHSSSIFGLPPQVSSATSSLVQPQLSPKYQAKNGSTATYQQTPIQRYAHDSSTTINQLAKLDNVVHSQSQGPVTRESFNLSNQSAGVAINSSKKHREFMRAQEISKVFVLNGIPAPNGNNRSNVIAREQVEIEEPYFQEMGAPMIEQTMLGKLNKGDYITDIIQFAPGSGPSAQPFSQVLTVAPTKRNNLLRHQSSSISQQRATFANLNSQQMTASHAGACGGSSTSVATIQNAQRAGSASTFSQQLQNNGQRLVRQGSEKTQRREQSAGSRLTNQQNTTYAQQREMPMMINSYHTNTEKEKNIDQQNTALSTSMSQSCVNMAQSTQAQSQNGANQGIQQSFSSFNGDLALLMNPSYLGKAGQQSQNQSRSHSVDLNKENSLTDEDNKSYGSTPGQAYTQSNSLTQATAGSVGQGGAALVCDDLSQVSEESAFEEDDYEEQKDVGAPNPPKVALKRLTDDQDDGKKSKKVTIKILASMPNNAKEEEEAFFASKFTANPVFQYDNPMVASRFISQFKKPRSELMPIATKIMDAFLAEYGSESNYFLTEGRVITDHDETEEIFRKYLEELNVLETALINFSEKIVAPTSVTYDNYSSKIRINIQVPIEYREGRITGVLHHEIGTHFLRRFNEIQQPWHGKRKKYGLKSCIAIEEGMGCINMMLEQAKDVASQVLGSSEPPEVQKQENFQFDLATARRMPFLFKPALNYYACYKASEMSFVELFNDLAKYVDNPKKRWKYVLRVKRGLSDTSQPGGLYKDQVYLEGAVKLLKNRKDINFKLFYCGKINIEDIKRPKFIKKAQLDSIIIPKFMEDMREYKRILDVIAKVNFID